MNFYLIIYFSLIKTILLIENSKTLKDGLFDIFYEFISGIDIREITKNLSKNCSNLLNQKYYPDLNKSYFYYQKLILDSSKSLNDISTFDKCMNKKYEFENDINNFSYILIYVDNRNNKKLNLSYEDTYFFAMCMFHNNTCKTTDYKKLLFNIIRKYLNNSILVNNPYIYTLNKNLGFFKYTFTSTYLIPFYIIIVYIIFFLFKNIFVKFFKIFFNCCLKKNVEEINKKKNKEKKIKWEKIIISIFSLSKNFIIFISKETEDNIYNDNGIIYIKGIKGISMILYLFGVLFFNLYNSPLTQKTKDSFIENLNNPFSFVFFFGIKYSPRILLSCSGFNLFYKFMCYFDEESYENKEKEKKSKKKFSDFIKFDILFLFIIHQLYKYVYFLLITTFFIFSFSTLNVIFSQHNAMPVIFNYLLIDKVKLKEIILFLFGIRPFILTYDENQQDNILNYFWLIQCETIFFLITSIILFFVYKYQIKLNRIIIILFIIIEMIKVLLILFSENLFKIILYPSFIYSNINYGFIYKSPLLNYHYFLIGVFFSMVNYSIQKLFNYTQCYKKNKLYLLSSVKLMKKIERMKKYYYYIFGFLGIFLIILFGFSQSIFFFIINNIFKEKKKITKFFDNIIFKIIMLFDTEFVIILIHLLPLFFYFTEEKYINNFLIHNLWNSFDKIYFSYILLINPFILYILYTGETKINFTIFNCFFYSFSCLFIFLIFVIICYILFELPLRRITKYFFKIKNNQRKNRILNIIEQKYNKSQILVNEIIYPNEGNENENENDIEEEIEKEHTDTENEDSLINKIKLI